MPRFFAKSGAVFGFGLGRICTRGRQPRVDTLFLRWLTPPVPPPVGGGVLAQDIGDMYQSSTAWTTLTSGTCSRRFRSMPILSVTRLDGHPTHAPWRRMRTMPESVTSASSMSPPSAWTAGRMRASTNSTRSRTGAPGAGGLGVGGLAAGVVSGVVMGLPAVCTCGDDRITQ